MSKLLMCPPTYYGIEYEINPWMKVERKVNNQLALKQWEKLYRTLKICGADISLVKPLAGWPDMVFTANAGLFYQKKIILSRFKYKERQGETPTFRAWFEQTHPVLDIPLKAGFFEGEGDALFAGKTLFAGFGFRTDKDFYHQANITAPLILCELVDPYFYHLDTCFCPLNENLAIWHPDAFTSDSRQAMSQQLELIAVKANEAKQFACNAVVLGKKIVLPSNCPDISKTLTQRGFEVYACDMTEYLKAGGACKCLVLKLN